MDAGAPNGQKSKVSDQRRARDPVLFDALCSALEALQLPVFFLDSQSVVLFATPRGVELTQSKQSAFRIDKRRLMFAGRKIDECVSPTLNGDGTAILRLAAPAGNDRNRMIEYCLLVSRRSLRRSGDPFILFVYEMQKRRRIAKAAMRSLYGLTHTECVTADFLFQGLNVREIAAELAVSVNTVRSHLKRIFLKCQVKSQAELIRLLALGPGVE